MRLSFLQLDSRRGSSRLIVLVALAAIAAGAYYFVGTGEESGSEDVAAPTKRVKRSTAKTKATDVSAPKTEVSKSTEVKVASTPEPKSIPAPEATPALTIEPRPAEAKGTTPEVADVKPAETPVPVETPTEAKPTAKVAMPTPVEKPPEPPAPKPAPDAVAVIAPPPAGPSPLAPAVAPPSPTSAIPAKIARYAALVFKKYDVDGSGTLEAAEREKAPGLTRETDIDADGDVSLDELTSFIAGYGRSRRLRLVAETDPNAVPPSAPVAAADGKAAPADAPQKSSGPRTDRRFFVTPKRVPQGLPDWFLEKDGDGDLQLTPAEYSPTSLRAELDDFGKLDFNSDGLLTADEYMKSSAAKPATPEKGAAGTSPTPATPAK